MLLQRLHVAPIMEAFSTPEIGIDFKMCFS